MHVLWCEFFLGYLDLGFVGVAWASNVSDLIAVITLCILVKIKSSQDDEIKTAWRVPFNM